MLSQLLSHNMTHRKYLAIRIELIVVLSSGPFCGSDSLRMTSLNFTSSQLTVVFYSTPGLGWRHDGVLRAMFSVRDPGSDVSNPSSAETFNLESLHNYLCRYSCLSLALMQHNSDQLFFRCHLSNLLNVRANTTARTC